MAKTSQENVIAIQLAKNHGDIHGKEKQIGTKTIVLGALNPEQREKFHNDGVNIVKKGGKALLELGGKELIDEVLPLEEMQKELGIESEFVPALWYIRRAYSISKYFSTKDEETIDALLTIMVEELKEGNIKETFNGKTTKYQIDTTIEELKDLIEDFETFKKELGV